ncbi:hypothetical protein TRSC58_07558 [Trypanosoma rangeli SC58]|uniref:Uncharacterized protein n=1 Tax=Trypanosoma rangeli SC58 TaxID=429131 RepID=A0A061IRK2_TRYRA|nr:hypothetical protein TRSC58_07558 [Trypanosoma rangeli SC58]
MCACCVVVCLLPPPTSPPPPPFFFFYLFFFLLHFSLASPFTPSGVCVCRTLHGVPEWSVCAEPSAGARSSSAYIYTRPPTPSTHAERARASERNFARRPRQHAN